MFQIAVKNDKKIKDKQHIYNNKYILTLFYLI